MDIQSHALLKIAYIYDLDLCMKQKTDPHAELRHRPRLHPDVHMHPATDAPGPNSCARRFAGPTVSIPLRSTFPTLLDHSYRCPSGSRSSQ